MILVERELRRRGNRSKQEVIQVEVLKKVLVEKELRRGGRMEEGGRRIAPGFGFFEI